MQIPSFVPKVVAKHIKGEWKERQEDLLNPANLNIQRDGRKIVVKSTFGPNFPHVVRYVPHYGKYIVETRSLSGHDPYYEILKGDGTLKIPENEGRTAAEFKKIKALKRDDVPMDTSRIKGFEPPPN